MLVASILSATSNLDNETENDAKEGNTQLKARDNENIIGYGSLQHC